MLPGGVALIEDHPSENLKGKSPIHYSAKFFRLILEILSFFRWVLDIIRVLLYGCGTTVQVWKTSLNFCKIVAPASKDGTQGFFITHH